MRKALLIVAVCAALYAGAQAAQIAVHSFIAALQKSDARMDQVEGEIFETGKGK
jgi:hypothetical protein